MIDLHSHLLPGLDDGSRSVAQSVPVLERLRDQGVSGVVLTPHLRVGSVFEEVDWALQSRQAAFDALRGEAPSGVELYLGYEIMLDQLPAGPLDDRRFSLAGSRYYLVEFPLGVVAPFATRVLQHIAEGGVVPLVAHPERYDACRPEAMRAWREAGARMQVDATAVTRPTTQGRRARALLREGLADVLASDNHGDSRSIATGRRFLMEAGHADLADLLTDGNPRAVLEDRDLEPVPPVKLKEGVWATVRGMLG